MQELPHWPAIRAQIILDIGQEYFVNWLESHTSHVEEHSFPSERGRIVLQRARLTGRYNAIRNTMEMSGFYVVPDDEHGELERYWGGGAPIRFTLIALAGDRVEVLAECNQAKILGEYFQTLLHDIALRWPQSAPAVPPLPPVDPLVDIPSERTRRVIRLTNQGYTARQIAFELDGDHDGWERVISEIYRYRRKFPKLIRPARQKRNKAAIKPP